MSAPPLPNRPVIAGLACHPDLFAPARGERCRLDECGGACCVGGIWVDVGHVQRILAHAGQIQPLLPADRRDPDGWFSDELVEHADFPSGLGTATAVDLRPDGSGRPGCVFLRPDNTCALQVASEGLGMDWPGLKPFDCASYPVLRSEGELLPDAESAASGVDCQRTATGHQPPFFRVFRQEIELSIGKSGYEQLESAYARSRS